MLKRTTLALVAGVATLALTLSACGSNNSASTSASGSSSSSGGASKKGGLISIVVNDPSNPYWLTEGNVAQAEAKALGYTAKVGAHKGDTNTESNLIDTAITNKSVAIILDPANSCTVTGNRRMRKPRRFTSCTGCSTSKASGS